MSAASLDNRLGPNSALDLSCKFVGVFTFLRTSSTRFEQGSLQFRFGFRLPERTADQSITIIGACVAVDAIGSVASWNLVGKRSFLELNEDRFDNYSLTMSRFVFDYRRERRGSRVLVVGLAITSDETSRLVLVGMQWFNEPTATVNLINRPESQRIPAIA
jgi:hypothetical protein